MDEFSKHLQEVLDEQKEHPERFTLELICDNCKRKTIRWFSKEEVEKYVKKHGSRELHKEYCEVCEPKEDDDES